MRFLRTMGLQEAPKSTCVFGLNVPHHTVSSIRWSLRQKPSFRMLTLNHKLNPLLTHSDARYSCPLKFCSYTLTSTAFQRHWWWSWMSSACSFLTSFLLKSKCIWLSHTHSQIHWQTSTLTSTAVFMCSKLALSYQLNTSVAGTLNSTATRSWHYQLRSQIQM